MFYNVGYKILKQKI